jgi:putative tricarboxylic transport membrane protein
MPHFIRNGASWLLLKREPARFALVQMEMPMADRKNFVFSICMVLLSSFLTIQCFRYPLESALFPRFLAVLLFLLSLVLLIRALRQPRQPGPNGPFLWIDSRLLKNPPVQVFAVTAVYIALISVIGFVVSTVFFIFASVSFLDPQKRKFALLYGLCYSAILYVVFHFILGAALPAGWLI